MTHNSSIADILAAASFAAERHQSQRRKNADATPYINHPLQVAQLLAANGVTDANLLMAALLHDTVEDTDTSLDELEAHFGSDVCQLVREVTDDKSLPKAERKRLQIANAPHKSDQGKLLKIADKICNLRDLGDGGPVDWDLHRKQQYLTWARDVVAGCRGVNATLDELFDATLASVERRLT